MAGGKAVGAEVWRCYIKHNVMPSAVKKVVLSYAKLETELSSELENHFDLKAVTALVRKLGITQLL